MAIEKNTYGFDTKVEPEADVEAETVELPVSMLAGKEAAPGDVIRLEVVEMNGDSGTVTVRYAQDKEPTSIEDAASEFEG